MRGASADAPEQSRRRLIGRWLPDMAVGKATPNGGALIVGPIMPGAMQSCV
jgi:hypothetical protein